MVRRFGRHVVGIVIVVGILVSKRFQCAALEHSKVSTACEGWLFPNRHRVVKDSFSPVNGTVSDSATSELVESDLIRSLRVTGVIEMTRQVSTGNSSSLASSASGTLSSDIKSTSLIGRLTRRLIVMLHHIDHFNSHGLFIIFIIIFSYTDLRAAFPLNLQFIAWHKKLFDSWDTIEASFFLG
ncbi:hypothetical protein M5K25_018756 [Dendrobium thyrsiflorum]|uniref:Uncharacterized protein n=1 Tax=Dendrobium thyrsiflorum TaxID=117978 RepID=A0ABD0UCX1_DENTH